MSKDIVKIGLKAEIKNIEEIERQIEDLQNKLNNMKVNLTIDENETEKDSQLTLYQVVELKIEQAIKNIRNTSVYANDGEEYRGAALLLTELVNMLPMSAIDGGIYVETAYKIDALIDSEANKLHNCKLNGNLMDALYYLASIKETVNRCCWNM